MVIVSPEAPSTLSTVLSMRSLGACCWIVKLQVMGTAAAVLAGGTSEKSMPPVMGSRVTLTASPMPLTQLMSVSSQRAEFGSSETFQGPK